jgi:hypothetical protein
MDTELVRSIAERLRYRPLDRLVGRVVEIADLDRVEEAIGLTLGADMPEGCRLAGPEPGIREAAVCKYGILDLRFTAPDCVLAHPPTSPTGDRTGFPLLRELGYLPGGEVGPQERLCDDPVCLEMLRDNLDQGQTWLMIYLEGGRPDEGARVGLRLPQGYLPRPFRIIDACVTNARGVWLWKHFYL